MQKGDLFTINGNKRINDRGYTGHIWRIVEEDGCNVWAVAEFGDYYVKGNGNGGKPIAFLKVEHDFIPCREDVLANLIEASKEPLPVSQGEKEQAA